MLKIESHPLTTVKFCDIHQSLPDNPRQEEYCYEVAAIVRSIGVVFGKVKLDCGCRIEVWA